MKPSELLRRAKQNISRPENWTTDCLARNMYDRQCAYDSNEANEGCYNITIKPTVRDDEFHVFGELSNIESYVRDLCIGAWDEFDNIMRTIRPHSG